MDDNEIKMLGESELTDNNTSESDASDSDASNSNATNSDTSAADTSNNIIPAEESSAIISIPKEDSSATAEGIPSKKNKLFIIGGIAAAVVIAAIFLIVFLTNSRKEDLSSLVENTAPTLVPDKASSALPTEDKTAAEATPIPTQAEEPAPEPTAIVTEAPTPTPFDPPKAVIHNNETQSELTGLWTSSEITKKRPYCIMFNNIEFANPQSGIGCADILYEALTEGGITRMMGVFEGLTEESSCAARIGSVRSARHYFASFADEYDSIFVHYGETTYATKRIAALNLDHLEGTYGIGDTVFYRDKTIKAPHNAFASLSGILKGIEKMKFRDEHQDNWTQNHFLFVDPDLEAFMNDTDTASDSLGESNGTLSEENKQEDNNASENASAEAVITPEEPISDLPVETETFSDELTAEESAADELTREELMQYIISDENYSGSGYAYCSMNGKAATPANKITLNYSNYMCPYLTYDEETGLYTRYQYKGVHIDYNTNDPLTFKNVIIQIVHEWDKDKNGYQDMELHDTSGTGYYITEGYCIPIKWQKNENKRTMHYYTEDGEILVLNNGKTFISAYPDFRVSKLIIE